MKNVNAGKEGLFGIVLMAAVCLRLLQKRKNQYRMRKKEGPGSQGSKIAKQNKTKKR